MYVTSATSTVVILF